ncbi:peptidoglycan editing factor PgeF [Candidatus Pelagibacter sp.]|nr:peptidoglycan editing factor PgeF [Candidatus Pelagibacter sp.]
MIVSKKLSKLKEISHGFFNNRGGCSTGIYKSLNCGPGSKDDKTNVIKNLRIVKNKINRNSKNIFLLHQIHSNKFVFVNKYSKYLKRKKADAVITDIPRLPIAILTADCAPILIYDKQKKMIAAIHAGWKGAYKGIISKVINFMIKKGCKKKNIFAVIGPCIAQKNYNVKENFKTKFLKKDKRNKVFFKKRKNLIYFDLSKYIKLQLKLMKITNLDRINIDTFPKKNNFFSARRSLHSNHDDYGRNISLIMIN